MTRDAGGRLTLKQEKFIQVYLATGNVNEAAQQCGVALVDKPAGGMSYVYLLLCPQRRTILYVGKGRASRLRMHMREVMSGRVCGLKKYKALKALIEQGLAPHPVVIVDGLSDHKALVIERLFISGIGLKRLLNSIPGHRNGDEIELAEIEYCLERFKPFDVWRAERPRSDHHVGMYWAIRAELLRMKTDPMARLREFTFTFTSTVKA